MKDLLDTDWVIDHLHSVERVVQRLEELFLEGLGISVISLAELYEGIFNSTNPAGNEKALQDFLSYNHLAYGVPNPSQALRYVSRPQ